jgi:hypothetical protein
MYMNTSTTFRYAGHRRKRKGNKDVCKRLATISLRQNLEKVYYVIVYPVKEKKIDE